MTWAWPTSTILLSSYAARWFHLATQRLPRRPQPYEAENFSGASVAVFVMWNPLPRLLQGRLSMAACLLFRRLWGIRSSILSATFCCMTSEQETGLSRLGRKTRPINYGLRHFG